MNGKANLIKLDEKYWNLKWIKEENSIMILISKQYLYWMFTTNNQINCVIAIAMY